MARVLVESSGRREEVELSRERTIAELIPELLTLFFGQEEGEAARQRPWTLAPPGGSPLPGPSTLGELAVADGSMLVLEELVQWPVTVPGALMIPRADDLLTPRERTSGVLPARSRLPERLSAALRAVAPKEASQFEAQPVDLPPGTPVSPHRLTARGRAGPLERMRLSWRESAYLNRLEEMVQAPQLRRCVTVAVMSPKGGVGKTTISALLGSLFALLRRDRIVAVDTNPDFGSLGRTLTPEHMVFVDDLLEVLDHPDLTATELDANLGRGAHGLMVLPAPTDPVRMARLDQEAYTRVIRRLQQMVGMVILDCGTGLHDPASRAALRTADQILLVTDAEPSTASLVAEAAAFLKQEDVPIWLVVNKTPGSGSRLEVAALESYISHARGLLVLPMDLRAANRVAARTFDWRDAPAGWKVAVREIAAALVSAWPGLGVTT
jgi:MinD-like ATPase involved in chromosome partitioning or flagellar assembly